MMSNRLRDLRKEKRLTLRDLAEKVNISYSNIAMIERGERNFTSDSLIIFSNFFNVSTDYLLGKTNDKNISLSKERIPSARDIDNAFYNQHGIVTEEQKKEVESFLKYISSREEK